MSMRPDLNALKSRLVNQIRTAPTLEALETARIAILGKKGELTRELKNLGGLDPEARKSYGKEVNEIRDEVQTALEGQTQALKRAELEARLKQEKIDVSQPARSRKFGKIHPITQTIDQVVAIFGEMGFSWAEGPEIETDWYNFSAINMPADHAARQMQDTFYMAGHSGDEGSMVLRTHTSPVQARTMLTHTPPIRIISPGRTFRSDSDATHSPMFHQVEGLVIDETSTMAHLKGVLHDFLKAFFGLTEVKLRFRPSYFPFTEPSAEVDLQCDRSGGKLKFGTGNDWMEILGSGMVNPKVLENCHIDPTRYQGFAFGLGIERLAMLKYGIPDLRTFFDGDQNWIEHYGFDPLDRPNMIMGL